MNVDEIVPSCLWGYTTSQCKDTNMNHPVIRDMSCQGFVVAVAHMLQPVTCSVWLLPGLDSCEVAGSPADDAGSGESEWISDVWVLLFQKWDA